MSQPQGPHHHPGPTHTSKGIRKVVPHNGLVCELIGPGTIEAGPCAVKMPPGTTPCRYTVVTIIVLVPGGEGPSIAVCHTVSCNIHRATP